MNELTQRGIAALKSGDRASARQLLTTAVRQDPDDSVAWLWLTGALDSDDQRLACLRQVLRIDPTNQAAARGVAQILERRMHTAQRNPEQPAQAKSPADPKHGEAAPAAQPIPGMKSPAIPPTSPVPAAETGPSPEYVTAPHAEPVASTPVQKPTPPDEVAPRSTDWDLEAITPAPAASQSLSNITGDLPPAEAVSANATTKAVVEAVAVSEAVSLTSEASVASAAAAASPAVDTAAKPPARRKVARSAADPTARPVFRARPSLVPALICFWLFLVGAVVIASLLSSVPEIGLLLAGVLFLILEFVVVYAIIRNLGVRYELTNQQLTLQFNGKRARVPIREIYNAELSQSFLQRLIGIGHIDIDAAVNGQLAHVRMHNIPQARRRIEQIMYLVKDNAAP